MSIPQHDFQIDPEFQQLIPPLTADERQRLEASLVAEGCRDALVVWRDGDQCVLVDGHNRYAICAAHDLPFETVEREFPDRDAAKTWILSNQLARRNLNAHQRAALALELEDVFKARAKANQGTRTDLLANLPKSSPLEPVDTRKEVAKQAGVAERQVDKVRYVKEHAPALHQRALAGDLSTHRAYELSRALQAASPDVAAIVEQHDITDPGTVAILKRLPADHLDEIAQTGRITPGGEREPTPITAPSAQVQEALDLKRRLDKKAALEAKRQQRQAATTPPSAPDQPAPRLILGLAEALVEIGDETVDIIITSPPYNLGGNTWPMGGEGRIPRKGIGYVDDRDELAYQEWQVLCLVEMYRVAKPGASLFYNHKPRTRNGRLIHPLDWLRDDRVEWVIRQELVWDRQTTHNHNPQLFWPEDERVYWLTKGEPTLPEYGIGRSSVLRLFGPIADASWHPAPFREELPAYLLDAVGQAGMTVLDPFAGSGTTLRAALKRGMVAIGVDSNAEYLARAAQENGWDFA